MLSQNQLQSVCLYGCGHSGQCRYIREDPGNKNVFNCYKLRPEEKKKIDQKVEEHIKSCKKKGEDPAAKGHPLGDNCKGELILKNVTTGLPDKN